ncbi:hypothetical protein ACFSNO_18995 [Streptomyces cirratus]
MYGLTLLASCVLLALSTGAGSLAASAGLLLAAVLATAAELVRSVSSWELAVSLAPERARASYLGVAGMSQSVQKSAGPLLLTGAVMPAGRRAGSCSERRSRPSPSSSAAPLFDGCGRRVRAPARAPPKP